MNCSRCEMSVMTRMRLVIGAVALSWSMSSLAAGQGASTSGQAPHVVPAVAAAPLADAAERADWTRVRALLTPRSDVNAAQVDGMTALHWATYHDQREIAELLLRAGAQARAANRYGVTPLALACTNGNAAIVAVLLKAG